jgi:hypothetical protein
MIIFFQMIPKRKKFGNFRFAWKKEKTISLLEMDLCANWQQIPEIPPRPPLTKGGWGDFWRAQLYRHIAFLVPARPGYVFIAIQKKAPVSIMKAAPEGMTFTFSLLA